MERLTKHHVNKKLGAYMACSMACIDDGFDCNNCEKLAEMVDRLAAYEDAMPLERAQELARSEKDGKLAVLPCKVGDIVYDILDGTPYATRALSFSYFGDHWACRTVSSYPDLEEFRTRIFLTLEEAEAALKKREAENETD